MLFIHLDVLKFSINALEMSKMLDWNFNEWKMISISYQTVNLNDVDFAVRLGSFSFGHFGGSKIFFLFQIFCQNFYFFLKRNFLSFR